MEDYRASAKPRLKVALALSGGGARGTFHLGFIEALLENKVEIKAISGSSAGAIVGGAIACGVKPRDVLNTIKSREFKKVFKLDIFHKALFRVDINSKILDKLFLYDDISKAPIPFFVCVSDLKSGKVLYIDRGEAKKYILASSTLAPFFRPVEIDKYLLADGGIIDVMPTQPLKNLGYKIIGINLLPNSKVEKRGFFSILFKVVELFISKSVNESKKVCHWYIEPMEITSCRVFAFRDLKKGFDLGYSYGIKWCMENLK